ncbi:hypothetical protein [uncultured Roseibium sp.]|uniref:hypothetical protein n=1 Tax=uncultured Roseibium sp. TaxID=1936171 RepID=UPI003217F5A8
MFLLPLSDPLWRKLDDAHRDRDIPEILHSLLVDWDPELASSLFWDYLCHQDTCYGATYASVPYLLRISQRFPAEPAVADIAHFLGHVSMVAFQEGDGHWSDGTSPLQGLPSDQDGWDRKIDLYRSLRESARKDLADPEYPAAVEPNAVKGEAEGSALMQRRKTCQTEFDRYTELLSRAPVSEADLQKIARIGRAFLEAQDAIAELCRQAYENAEDPDEGRYFLSGAIAAMGDRNLARLLESGDEGSFECGNCAWQHEYIIFGRRMACYASPVEPCGTKARVPEDDRAMLDYREGAPTRADGFVLACEGIANERPGGRALQFVESKGDAENEHRLRLFMGRYLCRKCGSLKPLTKDPH